MAKLDLVQVRAQEETSEAGSTAFAIAAVERQIASPDSIPAERRFMRKVLDVLKGRA